MNGVDRVFNVIPMPGKHTQNTSGLVDNRLFSGDTKLHAVMDIQTSLWALRYDSGAIMPLPLRQRFTGFNALLKFVKGYFHRRNIEIEEIK